MNPLVEWWRTLSCSGPPERPILVIAGTDDPDAVSELPQDYAAGWRAEATPTGRVADYLNVPVHTFPDELPEHDLLLVGEVGRGLTTLAARIAVGMFGAEPQLVVGHGSGISDVGWMDKVQQVRDAPLSEPPPALEALARLIADSAAPVLLDGVLSAAAAALAEQPLAQAPVTGDEPAGRFLLERADVPVWGLTGIGPGEGLGALAGLAHLRLALLAAD